MLTTLVTGGAGYIGSHVVAALRDKGRQAVVLDNLTSGNRASVPEGVPLVVGSVEDADLVRMTIRAHNVKSVLHFAASVVVKESLTDPGGYYANNTSGTLSLFRTCIAEGLSNFIFSSTAAVYGEVVSASVLEELPKQPIHPYGRSKLMSEWIIQDLAAAHGFSYSILRYFNVAGADPQMRNGLRAKNATHLIKVASEVALGRRPYLPVFGADYPTRDGTCIRDFIHVSDLAEVHLAALGYLERGGESGIYNCGYGVGFSVMEVIEAFGNVLGSPLPHKIMGRRDGDAACVVADPSRARRILEWVPRYDSLDTIVQTALNWEKKMMLGSSDMR